MAIFRVSLVIISLKNSFVVYTSENPKKDNRNKLSATHRGDRTCVIGDLPCGGSYGGCK